MANVFPLLSREFRQGKVDSFFALYNIFTKAGIRLPKVKYVPMSNRKDYIDDGILRIDDEGHIRVRVGDHSSVIASGTMDARERIKQLVLFKALRDANLLLDWLKTQDKSIMYAASLHMAFKTNSTDPD